MLQCELPVVLFVSMFTLIFVVSCMFISSLLSFRCEYVLMSGNDFSLVLDPVLVLFLSVSFIEVYFTGFSSSSCMMLLTESCFSVSVVSCGLCSPVSFINFSWIMSFVSKCSLCLAFVLYFFFCFSIETVGIFRCFFVPYIICLFHTPLDPSCVYCLFTFEQFPFLCVWYFLTVCLSLLSCPSMSAILKFSGLTRCFPVVLSAQVLVYSCWVSFSNHCFLFHFVLKDLYWSWWIVLVIMDLY